MIIDADLEGEAIPIPCPRCASLSTTMRVRETDATAACARCGAPMKVVIRRVPEGWSVRASRGAPPARS